MAKNSNIKITKIDIKNVEPLILNDKVTNTHVGLITVAYTYGDGYEIPVGTLFAKINGISFTTSSKFLILPKKSGIGGFGFEINGTPTKKGSFEKIISLEGIQNPDAYKVKFDVIDKYSGNLKIYASHIVVDTLMLHLPARQQSVGSLVYIGNKSSDFKIPEGTKIASINGISFISIYEHIIKPSSGSVGTIPVKLSGKPIEKGSFEKIISLEGVQNPDAYAVKFDVIEEGDISVFRGKIIADPLILNDKVTNKDVDYIEVQNHKSDRVEIASETEIANINGISFTTNSGRVVHPQLQIGGSSGIAIKINGTPTKKGTFEKIISLEGVQNPDAHTVRFEVIEKEHSIEPCPAHIAFVIDESGSINTTESGDIRKGLRNFITAQTGSPFFISFIGMANNDNGVRTDHVLNKKVTNGTKGDFEKWITNFKGSGGKDYWASGLKVVQNLAEPPDIVVIITDGLQVNNPQTLFDSIKEVKNLSHIFTYGINNGDYHNGIIPSRIPIEQCLAFYLDRTPIISKTSTDLLVTDYKYIENFADLSDALSGLSDALIASDVGCGNIEIISTNISVDSLILNDPLENKAVGSITVQNDKRKEHPIPEGTEIAKINGITFTSSKAITVKPDGKTSNIPIQINGTPAKVGEFIEEISVPKVLNPKRFKIEFNVIEQVSELEISENSNLQSTSLYMQAAGSLGKDGSITGIHLRWLLNGDLGDAHLPKGNYKSANKRSKKNENNDYVFVYKAAYAQKLVTLNFESLTPKLVDHNRYLWIYHIKEKNIHFYVYFKNTLKYNQVKVSTNALSKSYNFIKAYGSELIEVSHKTELSYAVKLIAASSTKIQAEVLSVEMNTLTADTYLSARQESTKKESSFQEENIKTVRYKANHIKAIEFELYADAISKYNWKLVDEFAITTDDVEAEKRLMKTEINGKWPRFNDGETANAANYIDRWSGKEDPEQSYGKAYYQNYDRRLKNVVKRYLQLSEDSNNPRAIEAIPFDTTNLAEGIEKPEDDVQTISNLDVLRLASMDYHIARMLGLGYIDKGVQQQAEKYVYLAEYKTVDEAGTAQQHLFMTLPTSMEDERLPLPVNLLPPVWGIHRPPEEEDERLNRLLDAEGYLYDGKQRFISLINEPILDNRRDAAFFDDDKTISTAESTVPVYAGIEYRRSGDKDWRKPELSNTSRFEKIPSGKNETVPILLPEENEALFIHRIREEGEHEYGSYGVNWFGRSVMSDIIQKLKTEFKPQNRLLPPSNAKACLIVEENPLMLTSANEQLLYGDLVDTNVADKTLIRLTFDHHIEQDKITYQKNDDSMGTFTDPLHEDAIFKDSSEVFADEVNLFFRNRPPKAVTGKIKSVNTDSTENELAVIKTEKYTLASTKEEIVPDIDNKEMAHFVGSVFMFNNIKYIVHKVAASNVAGEGPVFTVFKELISKAMMEGTDPDPTKPLNLPEFDANEVVLFNTVENMLTPKNWQVGNATKINLINFPITIGNKWKIHREIIEEKNDSGEIEEILEKSRGLWETATIKEAPVPKAVSPEKYDANGNIVTKDVHVGMYKITLPNKLDHHPQFNDASPGTPNYKPISVDWYQGIVRIHTQENKKGKRKTLEVVKLENVGTAKPLVVYALDAQYPVDIVDEKHDPILTGKHQVNFYPGYRVYLSHNAPYHLKESSILPGEGEGLKYSIFGLQASDDSYKYTSKIGQPVQFFAQEVIKPEIPLMANRAEFVYATRPDTFGKATFTLTAEFRHKPHGVQFFRSNDDAILKVLYKTATVKAIKEKLNDKDLDHKSHIVKRWQSLLSFDYTYDSSSFQTDNEFFIYPQDETGYRFPNPDNYYLYNAINDVLRYRNKNYGTNHKLLNLGNEDNDIGKIKLTDVVIPALTDKGKTFDEAITFKDFIKSVIFNVFTPLTEIPMIYDYINNSTYKPIPKKQVVRDDDGTLLAPTNPKFDMAPMAKKLSEQAVKLIPKAKAALLFTDFNLDGTSDNLYFYAIRELGNKMQLGDYSPVIGPIKLVNTKPPQSPDIRRLLPVLQNKILNILPGILVETNAYPKVQNIKQIKLYRTLESSKSLSVRTMDLVKEIDLTADEQIHKNIWKIKDEFEDLDFVPYGDPLYYRVTVLREVQYVEGSNVTDAQDPEVTDAQHPEVTEYVPSEQSKLLISSIVENSNPESPKLKYSFDANSNPSMIDNVILKWDKKVHNGKYHVYKMTNQGNWVNIHSFQVNFDDVQLFLADTSLQNGTLSIKDEDENPIYHHFKVIAENSIGMLSTEDKIMTIANAINVSANEGIGDMVIEYTNLVR